MGHDNLGSVFPRENRELTREKFRKSALEKKTKVFMKIFVSYTRETTHEKLDAICS